MLSMHVGHPLPHAVCYAEEGASREIKIFLDLDLFSNYTSINMNPQDRSKRLRKLGIVPTIQRLAILEYLEQTTSHPTADQALSAIRKKFPSISRATVYNTLEALTKAGAILRLTVDPSAARYDAETAPHAHFRCRLCNRVYDIELEAGNPAGSEIDGHRIESVRIYAYGVCASCRKNEEESPNA